MNDLYEWINDVWWSEYKNTSYENQQTEIRHIYVNKSKT